jgi:hypothetical protein
LAFFPGSNRVRGIPVSLSWDGGEEFGCGESGLSSGNDSGIRLLRMDDESPENPFRDFARSVSNDHFIRKEAVKQINLVKNHVREDAFSGLKP